MSTDPVEPGHAPPALSEFATATSTTPGVATWSRAPEEPEFAALTKLGQVESNADCAEAAVNRSVGTTTVVVGAVVDVEVAGDVPRPDGGGCCVLAGAVVLDGLLACRWDGL